MIAYPDTVQLSIRRTEDFMRYLHTDAKKVRNEMRGGIPNRHHFSLPYWISLEVDVLVTLKGVLIESKRIQEKEDESSNTRPRDNN